MLYSQAPSTVNCHCMQQEHNTSHKIHAVPLDWEKHLYICVIMNDGHPVYIL